MINTDKITNYLAYEYIGDQEKEEAAKTEHLQIVYRQLSTR